MSIHIAKKIFKMLLLEKIGDVIPVNLRPLSIVGTVQDDPFDQWFGILIKDRLPELEVFHSGPLTTPDIVVRDRNTREIIGIEVKKIDQRKTGKDSRGLTLDYNSCIPCGQMEIKVAGSKARIKAFYFFGLLSSDQAHLVSSCLMDGDFLNYDFDLHLQGKYSNTSEYGHGSYGEGSVRQRAMYNYPNPMNVAIDTFYRRHSFVIKDEFGYQVDDADLHVCAKIKRVDLLSKVHEYAQYADVKMEKIPVIEGIFEKCKQRDGKERQAYFMNIDGLATEAPLLADAPVQYVPREPEDTF